jgi:hypothetical protein
MVNNGYKHSHTAIPSPMFSRFRTAIPEDLLPWGDDYILSLFESEYEIVPYVINDAEPPFLDSDDDEQPEFRR